MLSIVKRCSKLYSQPSQIVKLAGSTGVATVPFDFARLGDSIVWISEPTARHSENAFRNGKAEFVVWDDKKRAVFLKTNVTELPESEKEAAMAAYKEKLADFMPRCQNPQIYIAPIGELDEKTTTGNWLHFIA